MTVHASKGIDEMGTQAGVYAPGKNRAPRVGTGPSWCSSRPVLQQSLMGKWVGIKSVRRGPGNWQSVSQVDNAHEFLITQLRVERWTEIQLACVWASPSQLGKHLYRLVTGPQATSITGRTLITKVTPPSANRGSRAWETSQPA